MLFRSGASLAPCWVGGENRADANGGGQKVDAKWGSRRGVGLDLLWIPLRGLLVPSTQSLAGDGGLAWRLRAL